MNEDQPDVLAFALYGDGPNVRPLIGFDSLAASDQALEAMRGGDGVWAVNIPKERDHEKP